MALSLGSLVGILFSLFTVLIVALWYPIVRKRMWARRIILGPAHWLLIFGIGGFALTLLVVAGAIPIIWSGTVDPIFALIFGVSGVMIMLVAAGTYYHLGSLPGRFVDNLSSHEQWKEDRGYDRRADRRMERNGRHRKRR